MYWCRIIPACKHPPAEGYNLLSFTSLSWKGASTPCSRLPVPAGRELLPPDISTSLCWYYQTEGFNPQIHCRPCFINFQTGSNSSNTTLHSSINILCPMLQTEQWTHYNQNIRVNPDFKSDIQKHIQLWYPINSDSIRSFSITDPRMYALFIRLTRIYFSQFFK